MQKIRLPAVAGSFYPSDRTVLLNQVKAMIDNARGGLGGPTPKALILPHAGYRFSGAVASQGIALLSSVQDITRVVILSPAHTMRIDGMVVPAHHGFETPLGVVPVDLECLKMLANQPSVTVQDDPHAKEHGIEVLLPLLQAHIGRFSLVPIVVGNVPAEAVATVLDKLWGEKETLFVISSDLSHYLGAEAAQVIDTETAKKIEILNCQITPKEACGAYALAGFLHTAKVRGMRLTRHDLTHSGRTAGNPERVVGYGCWSASEQLDANLSETDRRMLLRVAAQSVLSHARNGKAPFISLGTFSQPLQGMGATFVTLEQNKRLRGCIGSLQAHRALAEDVMRNAIKAGFHDSRFKPVTLNELDTLDIEIAYLSAPAALDFKDRGDLLAQLKPGRDGLILQDGQHRGTFLPKVWKSLATPEKFLDGLMVKAKLPKNHWSDTVKVLRYTTERFSEPLKTAIA